VQGEFGAPEVQAIKDILLGVAPGARIVLDFSHAEKMQEFAIAWAAQILGEMDGTAIRVHGLCRHHERILAYMGAHLTGAAESRPADDS
jgi:hypothetical protein